MATIPTEFRIFKAGENPSTKGVFIFDGEAAKSVMTDHGARGSMRLPIDYEHKSLKDDAPIIDQKAAGWFTPEIRNGELWATNVVWTPAATAELENRERCYFSPAFMHDETGKVLSLINVALTNVPALDGIPMLVAASRLKGIEQMNDKTKYEELSGLAKQAIYHSDPQRFRALKSDWEQRQRFGNPDARWEELTNMQRAALHATNPQRYQTLCTDYSKRRVEGVAH